MNKARNIIIATVGAVLLAGTVLVASVAIRTGGGITPTVFADGEQKSLTSITLDRNNAPTITDGSGTLQYNQYASFAYTEASALANGHVTLGAGGTIVKNEESNELTSFTVNFTGGLTLTTGYENSDDVCYSYVLENGTPQTVHGNYFKLKADEETNITSIQINFGCLEEETESHTWSDEWTHDADYHWHADEDEHCVKVDSKAAHVEEDIPMVAPTKESTGSYNGKKCSVCDRVLVEPTVLPILSATDYDISYRTAMINSEVRDSETYTLKTDSSISFDVGYGDTVYTEYIHAGSSYYSLNRWNELFPNARATAADGVLTITLDGDTTVTSEARGNLDGKLDLMLYDSVVVAGSGELAVEYAEAIDGIEAWNLEIQENAIVNLTGYDETSKTGLKVYGTLQIDGIVNVRQYGNAVGFNTDDAGGLSSGRTFNLTIGSTGQLTIDEAVNGINVWNKPTGGASINVNGTLTMTDISGEGIKLAPIVPINFNADSTTSINAVKAGIHYYADSDQNIITLTGNAAVTMTISTGSGILFASQGKMYLRDSSSLEITANSSGIYGFNVLFVCQGGNDDHTKNTASLKIHAAGDGNGSSPIGNDGRTKDGNPIQGRAGHTYFLFDTTGEILIEKTGAQGKTGIHLGGSAGSKAYFQVFASNMTIKKCSNAIGCWVNRTWTVNYDYESTGCGKVNIINCTNIYSGNTSTISTKFTSVTCNVITQ